MDSWPAGAPAEITDTSAAAKLSINTGGAGPRTSKEQLMELVTGLQDVDTWYDHHSKCDATLCFVY
jgi:hypothetical protein